MPLDTDFIRFSREMKPTKHCKISQKKLRSDQRGGGGHTIAVTILFTVHTHRKRTLMNDLEQTFNVTKISVNFCQQIFLNITFR